MNIKYLKKVKTYTAPSPTTTHLMFCIILDVRFEMWREAEEAYENRRCHLVTAPEFSGQIQALSYRQ